MNNAGSTNKKRWYIYLKQLNRNFQVSEPIAWSMVANLLDWHLLTANNWMLRTSSMKMISLQSCYCNSWLAIGHVARWQRKRHVYLWVCSIDVVINYKMCYYFLIIPDQSIYSLLCQSAAFYIQVFFLQSCCFVCWVLTFQVSLSL